MDKIDYLFFSPNIAFGGAEMQMAKRCLDAKKIGYNSVIALTYSTKLHDYANSMQLKTIDSKIRIKYFDIIEIVKIGKYLHHNKVENCVVSMTSHLSQIILARNIFSPSTKVILYQQMQSGLNKIDWFHNWVYKNIAGTIVITELMKKTLAEITIFRSENIVVIPCGIMTSDFEFSDDMKKKARAKFGFKHDEFLIGYIARFDPHKDHETLIRAFYKANIENTKLVLVGEDTLHETGYKQKMVNLCNSLNIMDNVIFKPFLFEVNEMMNCFDLFVIPSLSETLGLVIIEAMSCGIPVIGVNSGGVPELIKNDYNGYLIEQREIDKLAGLLKILKNDKSLRYKLGNNGRTFAKINFDYENQKNKFFDFCKSLHCT